MDYTLIHLVHIFAVFVYGGFLFTDNLFMAKMTQTLSVDESTKARESIMIHVRKVVPYALLVAVASGLYLIFQVFGEVSDEGLTRFQILLSLKAFLGLWLGLRGGMQLFFKINPWLFKSHLFPFILIIIIITLSQLMWE